MADPGGWQEHVGEILVHVSADLQQPPADPLHSEPLGRGEAEIGANPARTGFAVPSAVLLREAGIPLQQYPWKPGGYS